MSRFRITAALLAFLLMVSCAAYAEDAGEAKTCVYTVYNTTGEKITELYLTDNNSGEQSENFAGEAGLADQSITEIGGEDYDGYEVTLSFKTESGYEAAFTTLHFEDVPISLLPAPEEAADATTGATPIAFEVPDFTAVYTLVNQTGETVTEIKLTENNSGFVLPLEIEPMDPDTELPLMLTWPGDQTDSDHFVLTLKFVTESGYEAEFTTLHFETVKINLLSTDAMTGPTPISFGF